MKVPRLAVALAIGAWGFLLFAPALIAAGMDGVMMSDGKMMTMHEGKPMGPMEHQMTMSNGTTVMPDGTVKMKDGAQTHMKNGQMIMMDGHIMEGGKAMGMHQ
jgi:hypothetical protein